MQGGVKCNLQHARMNNKTVATRQWCVTTKLGGNSPCKTSFKFTLWQSYSLSAAVLVWGAAGLVTLGPC